jgi:hypothetical protein
MTAFTHFPVPDDARIGGEPLQSDALDTAFGSSRPAPSGSVIYGGADLQIAQSGDGTLFVVLCGERAGMQFGTYCFRAWPNSQRTEWINLPFFTEGRGTLWREPNALMLAWPSGDGRSYVYFPIPGYVPVAWPGGSGVASGVDATARAELAALRAELAALKATVARLEQRPVGLSRHDVEVIAWAKGGDRAFFELGNPNSGISGRVRAIAEQVKRGS